MKKLMVELLKLSIVALTCRELVKLKLSITAIISRELVKLSNNLEYSQGQRGAGESFDGIIASNRPGSGGHGSFGGGK
jgi:uncharacterized membrane protein YgcG